MKIGLYDVDSKIPNLALMKISGYFKERTPVVMPYNKEDDYQRKFARWVNRKQSFKTVDFEDYDITV